MRSSCHSRKWAASSSGVAFAFRVGRRRGDFNFFSRMRSHQAEYGPFGVLAFNNDVGNTSITTSPGAIITSAGTGSQASSYGLPGPFDLQHGVRIAEA